MNLEFIEHENGFTHEGVEYDNFEDLIQTGILGFCGCGDPDGNLSYVLKALELAGERGPDSFQNRPAWDAWFEDWQKRRDAHFGNNSAYLFFQYWADREHLTTHGGSVNCPWLEPIGEQLLALLKRWDALPESDE